MVRLCLWVHNSSALARVVRYIYIYIYIFFYCCRVVQMAVPHWCIKWVHVYNYVFACITALKGSGISSAVIGWLSSDKSNGDRFLLVQQVHFYITKLFKYLASWRTQKNMIQYYPQFLVFSVNMDTNILLTGNKVPEERKIHSIKMICLRPFKWSKIGVCK